MCDCVTEAELARAEIARQEDKQKQPLYRCLSCGREIHTHEGRHDCPSCSTTAWRVPMAHIMEPAN